MSKLVPATSEVVPASASAFEGETKPAETCGCGAHPCTCGGDPLFAHTGACMVGVEYYCDKHAAERGLLPAQTFRPDALPLAVIRGRDPIPPVPPAISREEWAAAIDGAVATASAIIGSALPVPEVRQVGLRPWEEARDRVVEEWNERLVEENVARKQTIENATMIGYRAASAVAVAKDQKFTPDEIAGTVESMKNWAAEVDQKNRIGKAELRQLMKQLSFGLPAGMRASLMRDVPDTWREAVERAANLWAQPYKPEYAPEDSEAQKRAWEIMRETASEDD